MKTAIVIPARFASTRYPGKPLVVLNGPDGAKTLIQRSWEAAMAVDGVDAVYVATDDDRIRDAAQAFGAQVIMTPSSCANGTERCAAALDGMDWEPDLVVNLQGDAPLTPAWFVSDLIAGFKDDPDAHVTTPVLRCDLLTYKNFVEDRKHGRVGGTTAVFDSNMNALYFSKQVVPYVGYDLTEAHEIPVFHHVGVYAYRPQALRDYATWPTGPLESLEGLEQLRFMERGLSVKCVEVEGKGRVFWELNNPEDVPRIEAVLNKG
ncbi:MAG: 3-deoxy-manno-octulosonate cytidylyltransferase [Rhodobacteraceae bacterium]|nr:MAG: 3-deoxy-manno-octulosonate cytidylyltransferase [Paracoccaceae bacterium]